MLGELLGNYRVVRRLGEGGMGEVYLAEQQSIGTQIAVKLLFPQISAMKEQVHRFFNEARAVAKIRHAGIVKIFDVGFTPAGRAYLLMELLEGESLAARLARDRLPLAAVCEIGRQIASVLAATHAAGITHRDLKPDNVFLVPDHELASGERVKVLDFGIAKLTGTLAEGGPRTLGTMGTPAYMSPEQWGDSSQVDARADVYSLGCLLFEMACGRPPFVADTIAAACSQHLTLAPPLARTLVPDLPAALDQLIARTLAKTPAARPQTMSEVGRELDAIARVPPAVLTTGPNAATVFAPQAPVQGTTLSGAAGATRDPPARPTRRTRALAIGVGLAMASGAVAALALLGGGDTGGVALAPDAMPAAAVNAVPVLAPDASPAREAEIAPSLRARLETENPFVTVGGLEVLGAQVSRREYGWYLASLPINAAEERAAQEYCTPLRGWDDSTVPVARPVAWVTQDQAQRYCAQLGAALPTSEQWTTLASGSWGLDPGRDGTIGPLQEWTSSVEDGLAVVRGGHARMTSGQRRTAARDPLLKSRRSPTGAQPAPAAVAGETIGFRCVRSKGPR